MKVLHIINSLNTGGAEKLIIDSVPIYQSKGINLDVLILSNKKTMFREKLEQISTGKIFSFTSKSIYNPILIFKIIPYLKSYDIVHLHLFPTLYWGVLAKHLSFNKIKIFYTEHSTDNRRRDYSILFRMEKFIYSKLDFIGCISQGVLGNLSTYLKDNKKVKVIHNGVSLDDFKQATTSLGNNFFSDDAQILIQIASFDKRKDQKTLIEALNFLPNNFKLILVGDGILRKDCQSLTNELKLNNRVKFLGIRNDVPELLNSSDVVVLSSNIEGFGLAAVEGMAANKPVVASNIPGLGDIVKDYGLLFNKGDAKDLAERILSLYEIDQRYNKVQEACYLRSKDFDIKTMVDSYIYEYRKSLE